MTCEVEGCNNETMFGIPLGLFSNKHRFVCEDHYHEWESRKNEEWNKWKQEMRG